MMPRIRYFVLCALLLAGCQSRQPLQPPVGSTDPPAYGAPFDGVPEVADITLYEINLRAFSASGTFQGVMSRLDSLQALGINTLWLMPVHPIGAIRSVNSPYSVQNHFEVSPEYGSLDDFRALVAAAHERGMAVIMDWVANHTAWDHPWMSSHPDWYTRDANGNVLHPPGTNWQDVADLNYENPDLRREMIRAMKYWILTANVDGYRCDAADFVPFEFWRQALDTLQRMPGRKLILLAEGARADHFAAGFQLNFGWEFYGTLKEVWMRGQSANLLWLAHRSEYNAVPSGRHKLRFTTNHDETAWDNPPVVLFGGKSGALAASVVTIFMGGVPLLYNGQEVGYPVKLPFFTRHPIDWQMNPDMAWQYRALLELYNTRSTLRHGEIVPYADPDVAAFLRKDATDSLLFLVNTRNRASTFAVPAALAGTVWTPWPDQSLLTLPENLDLTPYEYLILQRRVTVN